MKIIITLILTILFITTAYSQELIVFKKGKKYGFKDEVTNKIVLKPKYYNAKDFNDGLAPVKLKKNYSNTWCYINEKGKLLNNDTYVYSSIFFMGIALVSESGNRYFFIDKSGEKISNITNTKITLFINEIKDQDILSFARAFAVLKYSSLEDDLRSSLLLSDKAISINGKFGFIDDKFLNTIPFIYDGYKRQFCVGDERLVFRKGDKYGVIEKNGEILVDFIYDDILTCFANKTGIGAAKMGGKWGFIDENGKAITNFVFDKIEKFKLIKDIYLVKMKVKSDSWMELNMSNMTLSKYYWIYDY